MNGETLAAALEREHHQIDEGIERFLSERDNDGDERAAALQRALGGLRRHIYLEEEFMFPPLREAGLVMPIYVMLREHGEIWETMDAVDAQLACRPPQLVNEETCRELLAQLERHNAKEEAIIYPQAGAELAVELQSRLRSFLDGGDMPQGWRPAQHRAHDR